jgi:hypothetical protein
MYPRNGTRTPYNHNELETGSNTMSVTKKKGRDECLSPSQESSSFRRGI